MDPSIKLITYYSLAEVFSILVIMFVYSMYIFFGFEEKIYMLFFQVWGLSIFATGTMLRLNLGFYEVIILYKPTQFLFIYIFKCIFIEWIISFR